MKRSMTSKISKGGKASKRVRGGKAASSLSLPRSNGKQISSK